MRAFLWFTIAVLALPACLASQEQDSGSLEVNGVIKEVSVNVRRLTIETSQRQEKMVSVEPETRILVDHREGKLEELRPGQIIRVVLPKESSKAILIEASQI